MISHGAAAPYFPYASKASAVLESMARTFTSPAFKHPVKAGILFSEAMQIQEWRAANLGVDGQIYLGAIAATQAALMMPKGSGPWGLILAFQY